jgi:TolB protein
MATVEQKLVGVFESAADVGMPGVAGSTTYDAKTQEYTMSASGTDLWEASDEFHFAWKKIKGDFIVTARAHFITEGGHTFKKFGWIARTGLDANSSHVNAMVHANGRASLQYRRTAGAKTNEQVSKSKGPDVFQLERKGNKFIASFAKFGEPFIREELADLQLPDELYVGLFTCSHIHDNVQTAVIQDVRITIPAKDDFIPYTDYIGSNLEILDVETGRREIVYHVSDSLQAPNWTHDNKALIYSRNGGVYRFDLATRQPTLIDTGEATRNNNDHVISPDGRWLGISNNVREEQNKSIVYIVPIEGGPPRRITPQGHSYLHGWSPDGKLLIFAGQRNSVFDIYSIPVAGGDERRLTDGVAYNDGCEYSPDGKYIYFNSTRSGTMQLWRMQPDGSRIERVTTGEFNDWFPHFSPDGKEIAFLSFLTDIDPQGHPFYRHVYLRLMPASGGEPKVIAYLYGGQGTINVPSWSPDGRRLAFVSNTAGE